MLGANPNPRSLKVSVSEVSRLIDEWIFNARDRAIMKRRLCDGIIYAQIAEEFDLSDRQVKRIVYRLQDKIFRHLKH